ncbi:hypothetical protein DFS34DRAFT_159336 [Phlyctochytrium arcticum]|nr:hypothetical protein DFS34DRAFT_159336 [Phlyctochytrium arcticum]
MTTETPQPEVAPETKVEVKQADDITAEPSASSSDETSVKVDTEADPSKTSEPSDVPVKENGEPQVESATKQVAETGADKIVVPVPASDATPELKGKVLEQVEFWFGDRNLTRDKFLQGAIKNSKDGWIPISTLMTFNRMKTLTEDPAVVADAVAESEWMMEVSEDRTQVRRKAQMQRFSRETAIYAKGFPVELTDVVEVAKATFAPFGKVVYVKPRRDEDKKFKGSVFVEFSDKDAAKAVLEKEIEYEGQKLLIMSKEAYIIQKLEEKKITNPDMRIDRNMPKFEDLAYIPKDSRKPAEAPKKAFHARPEKALLHFTLSAGMQLREEVKEFFNNVESARWVDFKPSESEGLIQFNSPNAVDRVIEKLGGTEVAAEKGLGGATMTLRQATQEEEDSFYADRERFAQTIGRGADAEPVTGSKRKADEPAGGEQPAAKISKPSE